MVPKMFQRSHSTHAWWGTLLRWLLRPSTDTQRDIRTARLNTGWAQSASGAASSGPSFAYSLPVHFFHTRRDRVVSLPPCRLYGAAVCRARATRAGPGLDLALRLE